MPTTTSHKLEVAAVVDLTAAGIHSLANNGTATLATYDNATNLWPLGTFELKIDTGANATAGAYVELYLIPTVDGTNYAETAGPPPTLGVGNFVCQAATSQRLVLRDIALPPTSFKAFIKQSSGQATSASGSHLKMLPHSQKSTTA